MPSKYSEGYSSYRADTISIQTKQRDITPKAKKPELSFLYVTRCLVLLYISTKYHKIFQKGIQLTERTRNQCIITVKYKQKEITPKVRKAELSFLYAKHRLFLFYISTKYHQNIPKGIRLTERTRNQCIITVKYNKGKITPKLRKVVLSFLVRDTSFCPVLHFYQVSSKYSGRYSSYRADKNFYADTDADADEMYFKQNKGK